MNVDFPDVVVTKSAEETVKLAKDIAKKLSSEDVNILCLQGDLGAGKTTFVKGFCDFYGVGSQNVKSPTYTYYRLYVAENVNIYHFDYYRLAELDEIAENEFLEIIDNKNSIVLIEWPEKVMDIVPKGSVVANFKYVNGSNLRKIQFSQL